MVLQAASCPLSPNIDACPNQGSANNCSNCRSTGVTAQLAQLAQPLQLADKASFRLTAQRLKTGRTKEWGTGRAHRVRRYCEIDVTEQGRAWDTRDRKGIV